MDLGSLLTFIGVFVTMLCLLIGIAYYGIRDRTYEDALREKGIQLDGMAADKDKQRKATRKEAPKKQKQVQQGANSKQKPKSDADTNDADSQDEQSTSELELVAKKQRVRSNNVQTVPLNQVESEHKQPLQVHVQMTNRTLSESSTNNQKEKPKAAIKPNQTMKEMIAVVDTNGYKNNNEDNDDGFKVQGSRKDFKQQRQQQQQQQQQQAPSSKNDVSPDQKSKQQLETLAKVNAKQQRLVGVVNKPVEQPYNVQPQVITVANVTVPHQAKPIASASEVDAVSEKQVFLVQIKQLKESIGELETNLKEKNETCDKLQKELDS